MVYFMDVVCLAHRNVGRVVRTDVFELTLRVDEL